jgi:hypothetical protein
MKSERHIPFSEYTSPEWYYAQLAEGWFFADLRGDTMIMRRMSEWGYGGLTARQASLQKYATIWELNQAEIEELAGEPVPDWETRRQRPLEEYREWLRKKEGAA